MNDMMITVQGWLGTDPQFRYAGGVPVANFRVACTPRRRDRTTGEWVDQRTQWYGVSAWRSLADHCHQSLRRGDPVILHGRLTQRAYVNRDGIEVTTVEIDAMSIGHDLTRGVSDFRKTTNGGARRTADSGAAESQDPPDWAVPGASPQPDPPTEQQTTETAA